MIRTEVGPTPSAPTQAEELDARWGDTLMRLPVGRVVFVCLAGGIALSVLINVGVLSPGWKEIGMSVALYLVPLVCWLVIAYRRGDSIADVMGEGPSWKHALWAILATVAVVGVRFGWYALVIWLELTPAVWTAPGVEREGPALQSAWLLIAVVLAPLLEEIVFRGLIFRRLLPYARPVLAALASSLLFGLLHRDALGSGLLGLALVALYVRTRSLWTPVLAHMLNNLIAAPIFDLLSAFVERSLWLLIAAEAVCLPGLCWFLWQGLRQLPRAPLRLAPDVRTAAPRA